MQPTILLAEDDPIVRKIVRLYLEDNGFAVRIAEDGSTALDMFRTQAPDLLLTDLRMPGLDGLELLEIVAQDSPEIPVIIISGLGKIDDAITALRTGAWDYLTKPIIDLQLLKHSIKRAFERCRLLEKNRQHQKYLEEMILVRTEDLRRKNQALEEEIRERKIQQSIAQKARRDWEWTFDAMPDLIAIVDREHHVSRINKSMYERLGRPYEEVLGSRCVFADQFLASSEYKAHVRQQAEHSHITLECYHKTLGGYFELHVVPYYNTGGALVGAIHIARDINERKDIERDRARIQAQLLHTQKLESVSQLAAGLAHEINTPVQFIETNITFLEEAFAELLELGNHFLSPENLPEKNAISNDSENNQPAITENIDWEFLTAEIPQALQQSQEGLHRISSLIATMKKFSAPTQEKKKLSDLNDIITTTLTVTQNTWHDDVEITTDLASDLHPVDCFAHDLGQVILNLLLNALHAIKQNFGADQIASRGNITVTTRNVDTWVEMRIADNGVGISDHIIQRIFDPFFTTKAVGQGSGQGLAIAHEIIVNQHGGVIDVLSPPGKGTTFTVLLPRHRVGEIWKAETNLTEHKYV